MTREWVCGSIGPMQYRVKGRFASVVAGERAFRQRIMQLTQRYCL